MVTDYKASVEALTPQLIQETLKKVTEQGNVLEVVMLPAK
jgi:malonyl CoA-acyl carrier protein transacylase